MLKDLIYLIRIEKWFVNIIVLLPLVFYCNYFSFDLVVLSFIGFVVLCFLSSVGYLINNFANRENDIFHPFKYKRLESVEKVGRGKLINIGCGMFFIAMYVAWCANVQFGFICILFLIWQCIYAFLLRDLFIVDVLAIGVGYVLRVLAGASLIGVSINFLFVMFVFFLSCFILFCKRRQELLFNKKMLKYRNSLKKYSLNLLNIFIFSSAMFTLILYVLLDKIFTNHRLMLIFPFVVCGIARYVYLVFYKSKGMVPERELFSDSLLMGNYLLCFLVFFKISFCL